ncbi:hypothetical protein VTO42DRAFT_5749 [Malbranchea cinnamomea]
MSAASSERSVTPTTTTTTTESIVSRASHSAHNILLFLVAFRILNALTVRTFFQPDEFFQSLDPAWAIAFGKDSGAWITWEWKHHLRSSIHPYLFAGVYRVADLLARGLSLAPLARADFLIAAPKVAQAVFAALGDYFTWKLACRVYGGDSDRSWTALALTVLSPWQWFCSTRTLSNCLETTLTIVALYLWPWQWSSSHALETGQHGRETGNRSRLLGECSLRVDMLGLRVCLLLAAVACILRPTNLIIWACLLAFIVLRNPPTSRGVAANFYLPFIRETVLCGSIVLVASLLADRAYFGEWTFPPVKFLYFNLAQSLAVFYGTNDWHYYLSQGYPLLLTTALPFALAGLYQSLVSRHSGTTSTFQRSVCRQLAVVCVFMPLVLSLIAHKEVRFIYPILPALHVLTAPALARFFSPAISSSSTVYLPRRLTLIFFILVNIAVAYYVSFTHASGPLNVLQYLREEHAQFPAKIASDSPQSASPSSVDRKMTVGFLMPCHSTPWRSHLVFPTIDAWALTCEPPVNLNSTQKAAYVDEADQFYNDPITFLRTNMVGGTRHIPGRPSYQTYSAPNPSGDQDPHKHSWPDYLVFFAQLEPLLQSELSSSAYAECYRTWNTAWHDDWRRRGDVIVWCLDATSQRDWQQRKRRSVQQARGAKQQSAILKRREKSFDKIIEAVKKEAGVVGWDGGAKKGRWGILSSWSLPRWRGWNLTPPSTWSFSSLSPSGKKKRTVWVPWLDGGLLLPARHSSWSRSWPGSGSWSWSFSWPWAREKKRWWREWASSVTSLWRRSDSEQSHDHGRNLWS